MNYFNNSINFVEFFKKLWMGGKMVEEWVEATLNSSQDQPGTTTKLWKNYPEQTTETLVPQTDRRTTFGTTCLVQSAVKAQEAWLGAHSQQCQRDN